MQWESNDGGYMDGGGYMESQNTPQKQNINNSRDNQSLRPITIHQLNKSILKGDENPLIDGKELNNVHLLGLLTDVIHNSTTITFSINDGTGIFSGRIFLQGDEDPYQQELIETLQDGIYVSAIGPLRSFGGKTSLSCYTVIPVDDHNQITHHFLETIHIHLRNVQGPQGNTVMKQDFNMGNDSFGTNGFNAYNSNGVQQTNYNFSASDSGFSDPAQQAILDILGTSQADMGLSVDELKSKLNGRLSDSQLREALDYLTNEGHIYSTIDENHFKRTA